MTEAEGIISCEAFLETLKSLPWCKQPQDVLVAVHKCTPDIVNIIKDYEIKVFPGGMFVKLNKSMVHTFQEKFDEGQPIPVVMVWKREGVEVWYRRLKSSEFPYDVWTNPADVSERERAFIPAAAFGDAFVAAHADAVARSKECPAMIPQY